MREVREESGIICKNPELVSVYEFYREDKGRTYVSLGMKANYSSGVPKNLESEKRFDWDWYSPEDASKLNLFPPDKILIQHYLSGIIYE
ncbi:MAG: NUDIX domain-containing protein [Candidatus Staskawiczbacteria bacterium]